MAQARCDNGHLYDPEIYKNGCPYCQSSATSIEFDQLLFSAAPGPLRQDRIGETEAVSQGIPESIEKTMPPREYMARRKDPDRPREGVDPVAGWLVCIRGSDAGEDYRLGARSNTVGSGGGMDVRVKGDDTVSRDTHALIDYDSQNRDFYLIPGNNRTTIYLNRAPVYTATRLKAYDVLRFGRSEMLFIPIDSERFSWPDTEEGAAR